MPAEACRMLANHHKLAKPTRSIVPVQTVWHYSRPVTAPYNPLSFPHSSERIGDFPSEESEMVTCNEKIRPSSCPDHCSYVVRTSESIWIVYLAQTTKGVGQIEETFPGAARTRCRRLALWGANGEFNASKPSGIARSFTRLILLIKDVRFLSLDMGSVPPIATSLLPDRTIMTRVLALVCFIGALIFFVSDGKGPGNLSVSSASSEVSRDDGNTLYTVLAFVLSVDAAIAD
ncbi:hypothetical protein EDD85DRAFT_793538 [Armillaria nabsnona]|nr:hypothetical protein EDD85DRAFT_793538 [Armillaria nabsnona]